MRLKKKKSSKKDSWRKPQKWRAKGKRTGNVKRNEEEAEEREKKKKTTRRRG